METFSSFSPCSSVDLDTADARDDEPLPNSSPETIPSLCPHVAIISGSSVATVVMPGPSATPAGSPSRKPEDNDPECPPLSTANAAAQPDEKHELKHVKVEYPPPTYVDSKPCSAWASVVIVRPDLQSASVGPTDQRRSWQFRRKVFCCRAVIALLIIAIVAGAVAAIVILPLQRDSSNAAPIMSSTSSATAPVSAQTIATTASSATAAPATTSSTVPTMAPKIKFTSCEPWWITNSTSSEHAKTWLAAAAAGDCVPGDALLPLMGYYLSLTDASYAGSFQIGHMVGPDAIAYLVCADQSCGSCRPWGAAETLKINSCEPVHHGLEYEYWEIVVE